MNHSTADVIRHLLIDGGLGSMPGSNEAWPVYVGSEPDGPDNAITVYDTAGVMSGRVMVTGEKLENPGIQVRVRSRDVLTGRAKAADVAAFLDTQVFLTEVTIGSDSYKVWAVNRTSQVIPAGLDNPSSRRRLHTVNATVSIRQLT